MGCKITAKSNSAVVFLHLPSPLRNKNHHIKPFCHCAQDLYISVSGRHTESLGPGLRVLSGSVTS